MRSILSLRRPTAPLFFGKDVPDWIDGYHVAGGLMVPRAATRLKMAEILAGWKVRWDIGRSDYRVPAGVYAVGEPTAESIVLVTANYKLSFDALRKELSGIAAWILVLDTKGVNVWCAAGKGTFGTGELLNRINRAHLAALVSHRRLIVPQLGATGVSAHEVLAASGFRVIYGPVRAADIKRFLQDGLKKDEAMSRVDFALSDRLAVAPVELVQAWPILLAALAAAGAGLFAGKAAGRALLAAAAALLSAVLAGTVVFPVLLPWLPFRSFALKGAVLGLVWNAGLAFALKLPPLWAAGLLLTMTPLTAFLALNFTGASTYTNLRGTRREVAIGLPLMIATGGLGLALVVAALALNR